MELHIQYRKRICFDVICTPIVVVKVCKGAVYFGPWGSLYVSILEMWVVWVSQYLLHWSDFLSLCTSDYVRMHGHIITSHPFLFSSTTDCFK